MTVSPSPSRLYALQYPESVRGHVTMPHFLAKGILAQSINGYGRVMTERYGNDVAEF